MLATAFPDLNWLKKQANTSFDDRRGLHGITLPTQGWPNVIMNVKASRVVRDGIKGPLSIFSNLSGKSTVTVDKYRVHLTPGTFFITNAGQFYNLEIGTSTTETANIHFGEGFSQGALRSLEQSPEQLMNDDTLQTTSSFYNRVVRMDADFQKLLTAALAPGKNSLEEDQALFDILTKLVNDEVRLRRQQDQLAALKKSTKEEILKRMLRVTDYLYTVTDAQPDLDELSRISCLSKFHFLRLFKIAFGQTPHQFLTSLKIERAKSLLRSSQADAKAIASSLGYKDASSFSRQFFQHVGAYPSHYRRNAS